MENNIIPSNYYMNEVLEQLERGSNSTKALFTFKDALKFSSKGTPRVQELVKAFEFINSDPLSKNDYYKYLNAYEQNGIKLNEKYFKHDLKKLNEYYSKVDQKNCNLFSKINYESYVLYMVLKLTGNYIESDDKIFNVITKDNREYNPLSKLPSVLRGELPFKVKEYDIVRAFPTFIDIELDGDYRQNAYELVSKKNYSIYLNANSSTRMSIDEARKGLAPIYNVLVNKVITDERYNQKGKVFKDFTKYEKKYIEKLVEANGIYNYVRLHDGVVVLDTCNCSNTSFDKVEFAIKECIKPVIVNNILSFYSKDENGKIVTSPSMYADFLQQENFIRLSTPDDKIQLLKDSNNVVDFFNHKTDMVSFLETEINEVNKEDVRNKIAMDNNSILAQSYMLIPSRQLNYYKDNKTSFGLPFNNGFYYFDNLSQLEINCKSYQEVNGFFTPHAIQNRNFTYVGEVGNFEILVQRISTGSKCYDQADERQRTIVSAFSSMIGFLCHKYKPTNSPCIVLTDEGANDIDRKGGRCKTVLGKGIEQVVKVLFKGGTEYDPTYLFNHADLDKSYHMYLLDDVPCNFNYNALYTNITGGINVQLKGRPATMIEREDSPKYLITTNFVLRYDEENSSTNRRFVEYKVSPYYNINHTPSMEFNETLFEDWDELEWNKFYSYIFRCVHLYLKDGLQRISYDKTEDNFNAVFGSCVREEEMERIMNVLINVRKAPSFNVSDFLIIYNSIENPLRSEKLFNQFNTRDLISKYLAKMSYINYTYGRGKKWERK